MNWRNCSRRCSVSGSALVSTSRTLSGRSGEPVVRLFGFSGLLSLCHYVAAGPPAPPNRSKACFGETPKPALGTSALPETGTGVRRPFWYFDCDEPLEEAALDL